MADTIHSTLAAFRDTVLTAIARLEFQLRDSMTGRDLFERSTILSDIHSPDMGKHEANIQELFKRIDSLERRITEHQEPILEREFMEIRPALNTRNVLVPSVRSTPALAAAVAAASAPPPDFELNSETSSESSEEGEAASIEEVEVVEKDTVPAEDEVVEKDTVPAEDEAVEEATVKEVDTCSEESDQSEENEEPELTPIRIKKVQYYIDSENNLYSETEDGYEQVGLYDPETKTIKPVEEESEDEAVEVEDFEYKGKTYQRDTDNNVYLDGEQVGTWNGKKIIPN